MDKNTIHGLFTSSRFALLNKGLSEFQTSLDFSGFSFTANGVDLSSLDRKFWEVVKNADFNLRATKFNNESFQGIFEQKNVVLGPDCTFDLTEDVRIENKAIESLTFLGVSVANKTSITLENLKNLRLFSFDSSSNINWIILNCYIKNFYSSGISHFSDISFDSCSGDELNFKGDYCNFLIQNCSFKKIILSSTKMKEPIKIKNSKDLIDTLSISGNEKIQLENLKIVEFVFALDHAHNGNVNFKHCEVEVFRGKDSIPHIEDFKSHFRKFKFDRVVFNKGFSFKSSVFSEFELSYAKISSEMIFDRCKFYKAPKITNESSIPLNVVFRDPVFLDFSGVAISSYREIKNLFKQHHNDEYEQLFNSYEMEAKGKDLKLTDCSSMEDLLNFFLNRLAYHSNYYGRSLFLPLRNLMILFVLGILFYYLFYPPHLAFFRYKPFEIQRYWGEWVIEDTFWRPVFYSLVNTLGPLKFLPYLDVFYVEGGGKYFVYLQNILSSVLLYLFVTSIKKKFRQH